MFHQENLEKKCIRLVSLVPWVQGPAIVSPDISLTIEYVLCRSSRLLSQPMVSLKFSTRSKRDRYLSFFWAPRGHLGRLHSLVSTQKWNHVNKGVLTAWHSSVQNSKFNGRLKVNFGAFVARWTGDL